jgi:hypothetical protein
MPPIEFRNGGAVEERQTVKISKRICDFFVMPVDLAYPIHRPNPSNNRFIRSHGLFVSLGEIGIVGVAAAIANAVYHATGKRVRDLPITLDKLQR